MSDGRHLVCSICSRAVSKCQCFDERQSSDARLTPTAEGKAIGSADDSSSSPASQEIERLKAENATLRDDCSQQSIARFKGQAWCQGIRPALSGINEDDLIAQIVDIIRAADQARTDAERAHREELQKLNREWLQADNARMRFKNELADAERARDEALAQLTRFRCIRQVDGFAHNTACWIWGDDGQGRNGGPCNCGALINYHKSTQEAAEAKLSASDQAHAQMREALKAALRLLMRLYEWDQMGVAADGAYWRREILQTVAPTVTPTPEDVAWALREIAAIGAPAETP